MSTKRIMTKEDKQRLAVYSWKASRNVNKIEYISLQKGTWDEDSQGDLL